MLIGECDGAVKYTDQQSIVAEKEREQLLRDLGYRIVRWLAKEIMTRPDLVLARIERALLS
jgi:very-short-patch-repair endonuclease